VEVGARLRVAEDPPVVPGRVVLAEVAPADPPEALLAVAAPRPALQQMEQPTVEEGKRFLGHHGAVVGCLPPDDRVEAADDHSRRLATQSAQFGLESPPDPDQRFLAGFNQQFRAVLGLVPADVERQEVEPIVNGRDPGLRLVEAKPGRRESLGEALPDLFCLLGTVTQSDKIVSVDDDHRRPGLCLSSRDVPGTGGFLYALECYVQE